MKLKLDDNNNALFFCAGCDAFHAVKIKGNNSWGWNKSLEKPTFTPEVLVTFENDPDPEKRKNVCRSTVKDGAIEYSLLSTHTLTGVKIELPDIKF